MLKPVERTTLPQSILEKLIFEIKEALGCQVLRSLMKKILRLLSR